MLWVWWLNNTVSNCYTHHVYRLKPLPAVQPKATVWRSSGRQQATVAAWEQSEKRLKYQKSIIGFVDNINNRVEDLQSTI